MQLLVSAMVAILGTAPKTIAAGAEPGLPENDAKSVFEPAHKHERRVHGAFAEDSLRGIFPQRAGAISQNPLRKTSHEVTFLAFGSQGGR